MHRMMKKALMLCALFVYTSLAMAAGVLSKADTDGIFAMKLAEWEDNAPKFAQPNWKMKLKKVDTGTKLMAYDAKTGIWLSIQPVFNDAQSAPASLIVASYYQTGSLQVPFADVKQEIEADAAKDLGAGYTVSANFEQETAQLEAIKLTITKLAP